MHLSHLLQKKSVYFGLFLKWLGFCFCIQTDTLLIADVVCRDTSGQVSAFPNTQFSYKVLQGSTYFPCLFLFHRPGLRAILFFPGIHNPLIVKERALKALWIGRCGSKLQTPHPVGCLQNPALFSTHQLCFSNLHLRHSANWDQPLTILPLCLILWFFHFCRQTLFKLLWALSIWTITLQCLSKQVSP